MVMKVDHPSDFFFLIKHSKVILSLEFYTKIKQIEMNYDFKEHDYDYHDRLLRWSSVFCSKKITKITKRAIAHL